MDNPDWEAIYPVVLAMPAAAPGLTLTILPETLPTGSQSRGSALRVRAAAWKRRPAGVLCVERLEVQPRWLYPLPWSPRSAADVQASNVWQVCGCGVLAPMSAEERGIVFVMRPDAGACGAAGARF